MTYLKDPDCDPFRTEKALLIHSMLKHIPPHGWTTAALKHAAKDTSIPDADLIFASATPYDYVCSALDLGEQRLTEDLATAQKDKAWASLPVREKIARGVRMRLEPWSDDRPALRRAVPIVLKPQHLPDITRQLYATLDKIWRAAGDRSVDHNFYTKRAILALVYVPTLFFWLRDRSEGCQKTWSFLDARIDKALRIGRRLGKPKNPFRPFRPKNGERSPLERLRLTAALLRATFVKGKMHAKP